MHLGSRFGVVVTILFLSALASFAQCPAGTTVPSVHICSPANNATVGTEVTVTATAVASTAISAMKVYVDGVSDYTFHDSTINIDLILSEGKHKLTVKAWDSTGANFSSVVNVTATSGSSGGGSCAPGAVETVKICSPASGTSVASPVDVEAFANSAQSIATTKIYVDGAATSAATGSSSSVSASLPLAAGAHKLTVKAWRADGTAISASSSFTVGSGGGTSACTAGTAETVRICSPAGSSTVPSPVDVEAFVTSSQAVTATKIYVDGTSMSSGTSKQVSASLAMAVGSHKITVKGWLSSGTLLASSVTFTVGSGSTPPPGFAVVPRRFVTTPSVPVQYSATGATSWSVDGVAGGNSTVGTINSNGLYTPPAGNSTHTISATDGTNNASATVWVSGVSSIATYKYDVRRSGANPQETVLTPSNVTSSTFGKLFRYPVDGNIIGQPVYQAGVTMSDGSVHNVVFVATTHDSVYAFDADGRQSTPLWTRTFIDASEGVTTYPPVDACCVTEIGIISTMTLDPQSGTLYVLAATKENGSYVDRLHALGIADGEEKPSSPATITASVAGTGDATSGGMVRFDPYYHMQRAALLLANGIVYIGFGSYNDVRPYHGWLLAYDAQTLQQVGAWCATPDGNEGGIWGSGGGPAADENGNIYVSTGNGTNNVALPSPTDYGQSLVKFDRNLNVIDYFTPYDWKDLDKDDRDVGSSDIVLLQNVPAGAPSHLLATFDKNANMYVIDYDQLGRFHATDNSEIFQSIDGNATNLIRGTPAFWNGSLYYGALDSAIAQRKLSSTGFSATPASQTSFTFPYPGNSPVISANGNTNGILWATRHSGGVAILYAFDATNLSKILWESDLSGSNTADTSVRFSVPLVVNGRVYLGGKTALVVYGLLP